MFLLFLMQVSLMTNCRPATRPFRASSSNFFFLVVLLIGLALASVPVTFSIAEWVNARADVFRSRLIQYVFNVLWCVRIPPSSACGPFVNYSSSWEVVPRVIHQLPHGLSTVLMALASEACAVSLFVITWWDWAPVCLSVHKLILHKYILSLSVYVHTFVRSV